MLADRRHDFEATRTARRIVFMGGWIAKVHQHAVTQILGNMAFIARDDLAQAV